MSEQTAKRHVWLSLLTRTFTCAALLFVGVVIFQALKLTKPEPAASSVDQTMPQISVIPAARLSVRRQWSGFGTAEAMDTADVPTRVTATVTTIPDEILPGATVSKGGLLATLDSSDFERQVEIAEQNMAETDAQVQQLDIEEQYLKQRLKLEQDDEQLAQDELDRVQKLFDNKAARQQDLDRSKQILIASSRARLATADSLARMGLRRQSLVARKSSLESTLRRVKLDLSRCRIVSPLDGIVDMVDVEVGEQVNVGSRIARVVSLKRIEVPLQLPASVRSVVAHGDKVILRDTGTVEHQWVARVARISPVNDEQTRTMRIYVELRQSAEDENLLAPGQYVEGTVTANRQVDRFVVPRRAVLADRLLIIEDGRAVSRAVTVDFSFQQSMPQLGLNDDQWMALSTPLKPGELVVVNPTRDVSDGQRVEAIPVHELPVVKATQKEPAG